MLTTLTPLYVWSKHREGERVVFTLLLLIIRFDGAVLFFIQCFYIFLHCYSGVILIFEPSTEGHTNILYILEL